VDLVCDTNGRRYAKDKLSKNIFDSLFGDPKDIATKSGETHFRD